jgi:hypothetical protein
MSNIDPQNHYQPWSQKLQNLIDVSDDIVTMMSGTDDARLLALVANSATIGVTLPTGIATGLSATGTATDHISLAGTYSNAIKIGGVAGVGLYINKTANTAATIKAHCHNLAADGVDAPNFVANEFKGEFLSTGTSNATMDGVAAHFHMAASSTGILRAILGVAYLDSGKTLSGTDYTIKGWLNAGTFVADAAGTVNGTGVVVAGLYAGIGSCQGGTLTEAKYLTSLFVTSNRLTTLTTGQSSLILATNPAGSGKKAVEYGLRMECGSLIGTGISIDNAVTVSAIRIGNWAAAAASGSAVVFNADMDLYTANDGQLDIVAAFGESTSDLTSACSAKVGRFRHVINTGAATAIAHETYGLMGQLVAKQVVLGHLHAGVIGTLEGNTTAFVVNGPYTFGAAAVMARVGGSSLITATKYVSGVTAFWNSASTINSAAFSACSVGAATWGALLGAENCTNLLYVPDADVAYENGGVKITGSDVGTGGGTLVVAQGLIRLYVGAVAYYLPIFDATHVTNE